MKTFFYVDKNPYSTQEEYSIRYTADFYGIFGYTNGSYRVYEARLFGLHFASYLRMVRDIYGGRIVGSGHKYPRTYFPTKESAMKLVLELNKRLNIALKNLE